ncbi:MAG: sel1 repeat family protein [Alphaproteobacteria bacterium]|nr:sel1 repeat family protein [Alphaproteobacteria bacterium]
MRPDLHPSLPLRAEDVFLVALARCAASANAVRRIDRSKRNPAETRVSSSGSTGCGTMRSLRLAFVLLAMLLPPIAAEAGPYEDGAAAYKRQDYANAYRLWRPLAARENSRAQFNLGVMCDKGLGLGQNDAEAAKWYRQAAENGVTQAQSNLGFMCANGKGVP